MLLDGIKQMIQIVTRKWNYWTDILHSTTGPTLNFWQGAPTYTSSNFISLTNAKSIILCQTMVQINV